MSNACTLRERRLRIASRALFVSAVTGAVTHGTESAAKRRTSAVERSIADTAVSSAAPMHSDGSAASGFTSNTLSSWKYVWIATGWPPLAVRPICACVASAATIQLAKFAERIAPGPMLRPNASCTTATSAKATTVMATNTAPMIRIRSRTEAGGAHLAHHPPPSR